ncbi:unnamed protein product [Candidula unifasciata]|uniref:Uncharacterized protein n=1 Tax=Candidula unifasciata TaxID=100452 RepID=A0A8S3ZGQ5_9EUPU|nr:unnamed protein product [Candidula unifasciata]
MTTSHANNPFKGECGSFLLLPSSSIDRHSLLSSPSTHQTETFCCYLNPPTTDRHILLSSPSTHHRQTHYVVISLQPQYLDTFCCHLPPPTTDRHIMLLSYSNHHI